ncbi:MAG: FAD-dependent oxidoreductase, partial [Gammaproteobacteria bacterium]|nr:FAD-dependent oxidoreductase [Gammaproteobacteria bacterium]NIR99229.1 FAD-dependent oxidoreductase [Gammaproteobacteria bacterium]NIT64842.1 FAD-dependent oxidoreductase [Gammaproteobacteria bacterium]NIV21806.1 FAD-dependent oxidoreductase [Gammaproteobacteria bacterium]NIY33422.1 FAD-dependent oxidoreductase [Gammaproteobacteria bacterium]
MAGKHHVIIGGGTAGYNAIRTLRQLGSTDDITLVSAEEPYSRMVLPYVLEQGITEGH